MVIEQRHEQPIHTPVLTYTLVHNFFFHMIATYKSYTYNLLYIKGETFLKLTLKIYLQGM